MYKIGWNIGVKVLREKRIILLSLVLSWVAVFLGRCSYAVSAEVGVWDCYMAQSGVYAQTTGYEKNYRVDFDLEFCRYDYDPDVSSSEYSSNHYGDTWRIQLSRNADMPAKYSRLGNDKLTVFGYSSGPEYPADIELANPPNGYKGYPVRVQGLNEIAFDSDRTNHYFAVISSQDGDNRPAFQFLDRGLEINAVETNEGDYDITIEFNATADFTDWDLPPFELDDEEYKIGGKVHLKHDGEIGPTVLPVSIDD